MARTRLTVEMTLEDGVRQPDGMGGHRLDWQPLGRIWAAMDARSARERAAGTGMVPVVAWRIIVRGAPVGDKRRPRPGQRLRLGPRIFRIEAVAEFDQAGRWLACFAREEELA
ncbi:MAG: head-tail adaptor protein [Paracoccus sp. (in: a-proteobacteria)]|nr:head-tail adaptor protein [Paracoccus sp. (in: a-proteobacteria)]